jgi:hypothetical protein
LLTQLFDQAAAQHTTHPELFIAHSNKAACHLALGQHREALQVRPGLALLPLAFSHLYVTGDLTWLKQEII